jgi:hypothetical protein
MVVVAHQGGSGVETSVLAPGRSILQALERVDQKQSTHRPRGQHEPSHGVMVERDG